MYKEIEFSQYSGDNGSSKPSMDPGAHPLDMFFNPATVAVIGATERPGSLGRKVIENLARGEFQGTVYPVNASHPSVLGLPAYKSILDVPGPLDLAVIITPAATVTGIVRDCVTAGVRGAVIISSGFRENGPEGKRLEEQIAQIIKGTQLRVIGPNCLGVMNPVNGLNATFSRSLAFPGNVAFISQSGALCTSILDWSLRELVGFSAFVSVGSMLDVNWGDLIYYFGNDHHTQSIVMYMESIGDARSFLSAAREVSLSKPIIVIKTGRTEAAAKAAASHTGSLTGSDEVLDAAFRRAGVLRVETVGDLFYMADVLAKQPRPKGRRLAIVTNAGGPGVLAADALMAGAGDLSKLSPVTEHELNAMLPPHWSHGNPIDVLGDATADTFEKAIDLAMHDDNFDGILAITAPQGLADPNQIAEKIKKYSKRGKPILASFMGGKEIAAAEAVLQRGGIPTFPFPDAAAKAFNYMWHYSENLKALYETPSVRSEYDPDRVNAERLIRSARRSGRTVLTEWESKQLLASYGIPVVETKVAKNEEEAVAAAAEIGGSVVLKLLSETITHKSDVGGVMLDLRTTEEVRHAYRQIQHRVEEAVGSGHFQGVTVQPMIPKDGYELILGSTVDPQFGPVLLFGTGGELVEIFKDRALGLPPLNTTLARRMMEQTKIWHALQGVRGRKAVDLTALEALVVRFSQLVVEQPWIKELDINPLFVNSEGFIALDARVIVHGQEKKEADLPITAIRPYPIEYVGHWIMKNGEQILVRPIRPEDEMAMVHFHSHLSERSVYLRYFPENLAMSERIAHDRLMRTCFIDYDRQMALVAERINPETKRKEILGVGRLSRLHAPGEAYCAILVRDDFQKQGLGTELLRRVLDVAKDENLTIVRSDILVENENMLSIARKLGFEIKEEPDALAHAEIHLAA